MKTVAPAATVTGTFPVAFDLLGRRSTLTSTTVALYTDDGQTLQAETVTPTGPTGNVYGYSCPAPAAAGYYAPKLSGTDATGRSIVCMGTPFAVTASGKPAVTLAAADVSGNLPADFNALKGATLPAGTQTAAAQAAAFVAGIDVASGLPVTVAFDPGVGVYPYQFKIEIVPVFFSGIDNGQPRYDDTSQGQYIHWTGTHWVLSPVDYPDNTNAFTLPESGLAGLIGQWYTGDPPSAFFVTRDPQYVITRPSIQIDAQAGSAAALAAFVPASGYYANMPAASVNLGATAPAGWINAAAFASGVLPTNFGSLVLIAGQGVAKPSDLHITITQTVVEG